jgi:hypothetical protein
LSRKNVGKIITTVLLIGLGVVGIWSVLYNTRFGAYITGDAIVYIQGAENILAGNGYSTLLGRGEISPITGFPPLTSISLALTNWGLGGMFQTGRWLNAVLFGSNIVLAGFVVYRYARAALPAVLAAAMITAQQALITIHSWVMSEGLFTFILLLTLWVIAEYFWSGRKWLLVLAGILTALCFLTRYLGIVLVPVIGIGLLFFGRQNWKDRLGAILVFGSVSMTPMALWLLRNQMVYGSMISRQTGLHLMSQQLRGLLGDTIFSWFYLTKLGLYWKMRVLTFGALFGAYLSWFGWTVYKSKTKETEQHTGGYPLPVLLTILFALYIAFIWINSSILDPNTSKSAIVRYVTPLFVPTVVMVTCIASFIAGHSKGIAPKLLFTGIGALLLLYYGSGWLAYIQNNWKAGHSYSDMIKSWTADVALLKQLSPNAPLVSNDIQLLYALSNRYSYGLPPTAASIPGVFFEVDTNKLFDELSPNGYLVIIAESAKVVSDILPENIQEQLALYNHADHVWVYILPTSTP